MGTNYNLKLVQEPSASLQGEIDSVLVGFNASLSTYDPNSEISQINQSKKSDIKEPEKHVKVLMMLETARTKF